MWAAITSALPSLGSSLPSILGSAGGLVSSAGSVAKPLGDMFGGSGLDSSSATTGPQNMDTTASFGGARKGVEIPLWKLLAGGVVVVGGVVLVRKVRGNG